MNYKINWLKPDTQCLSSSQMNCHKATYILKLEQIKLLTVLRFFLRENETLTFKLLFLSVVAQINYIYYIIIYNRIYMCLSLKKIKVF